MSRAAPDPAAETDVADFLVALGEAMVDAGDPVTHVRASLERVAPALAAVCTEVVVLATALFVSVPGSRPRTRQWPPPVGARPRSPTRPAWPGMPCLAFGIALILRGRRVDVAVATGLGLLVGVVEVAVRRFAPSFGVFLPVAAAFGVALAVFLLVDVLPEALGDDPTRPSRDLPARGAADDRGHRAVDRADDLRGPGRLSAGVMRLVLLAAGIVGAAAVAGGAHRVGHPGWRRIRCRHGHRGSAWSFSGSAW